MESSQATQALQLQVAEEEREREAGREKVRERVEDRERASQQLRRSVVHCLNGGCGQWLSLQGSGGGGQLQEEA